MHRYIGDFPRNGERIETESKDEAEQWLREMDSAGATVTDRLTGEVGRFLYTGQIAWAGKNGKQVTPEIHTHSTVARTYAVLAISKAAFDEISARLLAAGYTHVFDGCKIDMHGIALEQER